MAACGSNGLALSVRAWARNPLVIDGAETANELSAELGLIGAPIEQLEDDFNTRRSTGAAPQAERFLIDEIEFASDFGEVFFTDANGYNAALTNLTSDFVQSDEDWWQDAWANGLSISDVEFDESSGIFSVDVSDPSSPAIVGSVLTQGTAAEGVAVSGATAYVADSGFQASGLNVIDVSSCAPGTVSPCGFSFSSLAFGDPGLLNQTSASCSSLRRGPQPP